MASRHSLMTPTYGTSSKGSVRTSRDPPVHHSHHLPCAAFLPHHNSRSLGDACANADDSTRSLSVDEFDSKDYRVILDIDRAPGWAADLEKPVPPRCELRRRGERRLRIGAADLSGNLFQQRDLLRVHEQRILGCWKRLRSRNGDDLAGGCRNLQLGADKQERRW